MKIDPHNFTLQHVCDLLLQYLGSQLGNHLSEKGAKAWKKLLDTLVIVVAAEQEKIVAEMNDQ